MTWTEFAFRGLSAIFFLMCGWLFLRWGFDRYAASGEQILPVAFAVLLVALGAYLVLYATVAHVTTGMNLDLLKRAYVEVKTFFTAPIFYVILGCMFLYVSFVLLNRAHPAFLLLVAILGVAILLYGTGTQAAMTGQGDNKQIGASAQIAIAGGAGALAAFFGFGVVYMNTDIQKVFKRTMDYGVLEIVTSRVLDGYAIQAKQGDGRPLHQWINENKLQLLIPFNGVDSRSIVAVSLTSEQANAAKVIDVTYTIKWTEDARVAIAVSRDNARVDQPSAEPVRVAINPGVNSENTYWVEHVLTLPTSAILTVTPQNHENERLQGSTVTVTPQ